MAEHSELYEKGLAVRKSVIGASYVESSLAATTDFNRPIQDLVTEFAWGGVWGRDALDKKTRSLVNLSMITALNHHAELALHVKGAIANGCSVTEIREVLLQTAVYCGFPAALSAFRTAATALTELGIDLDGAP